MIRWLRRLGLLVRAYRRALRDERAALNEAIRHALVSDAAVEIYVNTAGRLSNPKWDDPIAGYQTFSESQKQFLRAKAREELIK